MTDATTPASTVGGGLTVGTTSPATPADATAGCVMTIGDPTGPAWTPLHCAVHGPKVAWISRSDPDPATAAASSWANHLRREVRAAEVQAASERRLAAPYAARCTYDTGAQFDCAPACTARPTHRIEHYMSCYGWFVDDVCDRHRGAVLGRVYPDRVRVRPIPEGRRLTGR